MRYLIALQAILLVLSVDAFSADNAAKAKQGPLSQRYERLLKKYQVIDHKARQLTSKKIKLADMDPWLRDLCDDKCDAQRDMCSLRALAGSFQIVDLDDRPNHDAPFEIPNLDRVDPKGGTVEASDSQKASQCEVEFTKCAKRCACLKEAAK